MADITSNLIAHLKLEEYSGASTFVDSSPFGNDASETGSVTAGVTGKFGKGVLYSGTASNCIDLDASISLTGECTVAAWLKSDTWDSAGRCLGGQTGSTNDQLVVNGSGVMYVRLAATNYNLSGAQSITDGEWHHLAFTRDASDVWRGYIDGVEQSLTPTAAGTFTLQRLGAVSTFLTHDGEIDDIRVYTRQLVQADITALQDPPDSDIVSGLISHWKMDDGSGLTAVDSISSHNGTVAGTPSDGSQWIAGKFDGAIYRDGSSSGVNVTSHADFQTTTYTMAFWLRKFATPGTECVFAVQASGLNRTFGIYVNDSPNADKILFSTGDGTLIQINSSVTLENNKWYHVAQVCDGAYLMGYVNGILEAGPTDLAGHIATGAWTVALASGNNLAVKHMDDARFYNRALAAPDIVKLASSSLYGGGDSGPPLAHALALALSV